MNRVSGLTGYSEHALVTRRTRSGPRPTITFTVLAFVLLFLSLIRSDAMAQGPHKVLVIHSYHQEFPWTQGTDRSFRETLESSGLDIEYHTEYLDTKRTDRATTFTEMEAVFARKFSGLVFDLVFVSDNDALDFILPRRDMLCPHAPIVFSGINGFSPELIRGQERVAGVAEATEMAGTVELALRLHPELRRVVGISDDLTSARLHMEQFKALATRYHGRLEFIGLSGLSTEELLDALKKLPRDSVVLHFSFFRDRKGRQFSLRESVELVTASSPAPVYTLWDWKVDWGVVGGEVASSALQGKLAAELAIRILNGESAENIPVIMNQTTVPMFSYPAMVRQRITEDQLPQDSVVLHRPYSFFRSYRHLVLGISLLFALQLIIISMLLLGILKRRRAELALRESEGKYRSIFENAIEGLFRSTPDGCFVSVSPSLARMYGYDSPEELIASVRDIASDIYIRPEDRARFIEEMKEHDVVTGFEHEVRRKDGSTVWVSVSARAVRNENWEIISIEGFVLDITERKYIEKSLQQEQEFIRALLENMVDGVVACDAEGRLVLFNRTARDWHGVDPVRIPQEEWASHYNLYAEDGTTPLTVETMPLARAYRGERLRDAALVIKAKGQPPRYVTSHCAPFYDSGGQLLGAVAVMRDLTEARRVQLALQESEERFRQVVESSPMPIGIADSSGRIDYINPRFRETFGYSLEEIGGLDQWFTRAYPDAAYRQAIRDQWTEVLKEAAREQRPSAVIDVHVTCRDGSERIMEVFGAVVGERVIAVFNDLTEHVRSEAALRESVVEKESLLKEVHHRVKNNLQIINSLLQLQARKVQNEDVHGFLKDAQNRVRSMALLHETLYRSGNVARVNLPQYVKEVCTHIARSCGAVPGRIELRQELADVTLDLDMAIPAGLIISELVTNAFKHAFPSRSEGEIVVSVQNVEEKHLALRVSDNGVGLPADPDPLSAETLGLLLVRSLTRQMDGRMTISGENGTLFEIIFPVRSL